MVIAGALTGNKSLQNTGAALQKQLVTDPAAAVAKQKFQYDAALEDIKSKNKYEIALAKAEGKKPGEALTEGQINKIADYEQTIGGVEDLVSRLDNHIATVGPAAGRSPFRQFTGDQAAFDADLGSMNALYRKAITGTGMGESERKELDANRPSSKDTLSVFKAKAESLIRISNKQKQRELSALERGGRNVSGFAKAAAKTSTTEAAQEKTIRQPDGSYKAFRKVPGGWVPK